MAKIKMASAIFIFSLKACMRAHWQMCDSLACMEKTYDQVGKINSSDLSTDGYCRHDQLFYLLDSVPKLNELFC